MNQYADGELERVPCPVCSAAESRSTPYNDGAMKIRRCQGCSLYYLTPRLSATAMEAHYRNSDYFEGGDSGYDSYEAQGKSLRMTFRRLLRTLRKRGVGGDSCLDVGCGYGYFLQEAAPHFEKRVGTDFSDGALRKASSFATQVIHGGIEDVDDDQKFDLITALHVVEHVYDPGPFVKNLYTHLKPGGTMLLAAPHMGSYWRHLLRHRWPSFKYPEHVSYFDRTTLKRLLSTTGSPELRSCPYPHAFPLDLVLGKLRIPTMSWMARHALWMPATTVAMTVTKPKENQQAVSDDASPSLSADAFDDRKVAA